MAKYDHKEYARQLRENCAKDAEGVIRCSPELWEQIATIIESSEEAKQEEKLKQIIATERKKLKAYEQIVRGYVAYIAILLRKLGATKDNAITITAEEVAEAQKKYETRGIPIDGGFSLYYEDVEDDGVQAEIEAIKREKGN